MIPIVELADADMAFPARALQWMPKWEDIPDEFRDGESPYCQLFQDWFYTGLEEIQFATKEGIDPAKAFRMIKATMGSFAPKHEHKEAAVAYMFSEFFAGVRYVKKGGQEEFIGVFPREAKD